METLQFIDFVENHINSTLVPVEIHAMLQCALENENEDGIDSFFNTISNNENWYLNLDFEQTKPGNFFQVMKTMSWHQLHSYCMYADNYFEFWEVKWQNSIYK